MTHPFVTLGCAFLLGCSSANSPEPTANADPAPATEDAGEGKDAGAPDAGKVVPAFDASHTDAAKPDPYAGGGCRVATGPVYCLDGYGPIPMSCANQPACSGAEEAWSPGAYPVSTVGIWCCPIVDGG